MKVKNFTCSFLDKLSHKAENSSRLRHHENIHHDYQDPCQRLFNAIGINSYIRPHRHLADPKTECLLAVRGLMTVVTFDDEGKICEAVQFGALGCRSAQMSSASVGVELLPGVWHTVIANVPNSILFEVKGGPFDPGRAKEFAEWAPAEGTVLAQEYLKTLRNALDIKFPAGSHGADISA